MGCVQSSANNSIQPEPAILPVAVEAGVAPHIAAVVAAPKLNAILPEGPAPVPAVKDAAINAEAKDKVKVARPAAKKIAKPKNLTRSIKDGDLESVKTILEALKSEGSASEKIKEALEERTMWNNTPLLLACQYGHDAISRLLIEYGSDVNAVNEKGCVPLLYAVLEGLIEVSKLLLAKGASASPHAGLAYSSKADMNIVLSPLDAAAINGNFPLVEMLLVAGAKADRPADVFISTDPDAEIKLSTNDVKEPLLHALSTAHVAIVNILLKNGAKASAMDHNGTSALLYACRANSEVVIQTVLNALLSAKEAVPLNASTASGGVCPLSLVASKGFLKALQTLIKCGANVNEINADGTTALFLASAEGHHEVVEELLKRGADITIKTPDGRTSLDVATAGGHDIVESMLKDAVKES